MIGKQAFLKTQIVRDFGWEKMMYDVDTPLCIIDSKFNTKEYVAVTTDFEDIPSTRFDVSYVNDRDIKSNKSTWFFVNVCDICLQSE